MQSTTTDSNPGQPSLTPSTTRKENASSFSGHTTSYISPSAVPCGSAQQHSQPTSQQPNAPQNTGSDTAAPSLREPCRPEPSSNTWQRHHPASRHMLITHDYGAQKEIQYEAYSNTHKGRVPSVSRGTRLPSLRQVEASLE